MKHVKSINADFALYLFHPIVAPNVLRSISDVLRSIPDVLKSIPDVLEYILEILISILSSSVLGPNSQHILFAIR